MSDLTTTARPSNEAQQQRQPAVSVRVAAPDEPTLITEQQVLLGTAAAAVAVPRNRRWTGGILSAIGAMGSWVADAAKPPAPRLYPARRMYVENALMAREMNRL